MFSVIIATSESERALVPTLAALVPGAMAGVVREVIVADARSHDQTAEVADIAGCRFFSSSQSLGNRLKEAAAGARGTWLMFLRPGLVPGPAWIDDVVAFIDDAERKDKPRAAVFDTGARGVRTLIRRSLGFLPASEQGLIIAKSFYDELGGHSGTSNPETALLRRIGRSRIVTLRVAVTGLDI